MQIPQLLERYYDGNCNHIVYHSIIVAGVLVGAIRFSKLSTSSRLFFLLLAITPPIELLGFHFALKYKNNSPVSNIFTLAEFFVFCLAFYWDSHMRSILFLFSGLLLFSIINGLFLQHFLKEQTTNTTLLLSLCEIVIYFLFLVLYFKTVDSSSLFQFPLFWIGLGILLFSIVSIVAFGFLEIVKKGESLDRIVGYARQCSNYLLYLLFIPAFLSSQKSLHDFTGAK